jgi:triosephosphate isomerase
VTGDAKATDAFLPGVRRGGGPTIGCTIRRAGFRWAIGTGRNATSAQAQEAHAFVRHTLRDMSDESTADRVRIQYGGSVKPDNARELMSQPDIDGALVGGASLDPRSFAQIVKAAREE